jgi:2-polyprenyl-6-methoxyphenol hydroxylase-like FAD-dependent oxidoreductase
MTQKKPSTSNTRSARHAVVIGGSVGGMTAARILTNHFDRVTIIERDAERIAASFRAGAPHARRPHLLMLRGQRILDRLFPGLVDDLRARGAVAMNVGRELNWFVFGSWRPSYDSQMVVTGCSRPLLELAIAQRLAANPKVHFIYHSQVTGLLTDTTGKQVTGVCWQDRDTGRSEDLWADLVVDASGRESRTPDWFKALGYAAPSETIVNGLPGYATRIFSRLPNFPAGRKVLYVQPTPPDNKRGAVITAMEDGRWHVTLIGMGGDYPAQDEAGFMEFARSLPTPVIAEALRGGEPLTDIYGYRKAENRLRHYDRLPAYLENFLVFGDAVYAFNPVYGQGMTVAAIGAEMLDTCLHEQKGDWTGLAEKFQKRLAKDVVALPWQMATGEDRRWAAGEKAQPFSLVEKLMQGYMNKVQRATLTSAAVTEAFYKVAQMGESPALLFRPDILWQVLTAKPQVTATSTPKSAPTVQSLSTEASGD